MAEKTFTYAGVAVPPGPSIAVAIALHARLQLRRIFALRAIWPYLLIVLGVALGSLGLVRLSLANAGAYVAYFQTFALRAVALMALGLATAAVRSDTDAGTMAYYLLRPRAEIGLPLGRWLATVAATSMLGWLLAGAVLLSTAGTMLTPNFAYVLRMFLSVVLAAIAYNGVFLLIAALFRAGAAVGLVWLVAVDLVTGSLSGNLSLLAPTHYLAVLSAPAPEQGLWQQGEVASLAAAALGLCVLAVVGLAGTLLRFRGDPPR